MIFTSETENPLAHEPHNHRDVAERHPSAAKPGKTGHPTIDINQASEHGFTWGR